MKSKFVKNLLGAALAVCFVQTAHAAETIKAVVIDGYPAKAMWVAEFSKFFIPEVDKRLAETGNYQMQWQESWLAYRVATTGSKSKSIRPSGL